MPEFKDEEGRVRRTAVRPKGDMFDGFLLNEKLIANREPAHFSDYPETVLDVLRQIYKLWKFDSAFFPTKKRKSQFEMWVKELNQLNTLFKSSKHCEVVMQRAFKNYDASAHKITIKSPASLYSLVATASAELNREQANEEVARAIVGEQASDAVVESSISRLKKMLREEKAIE